MSQNRPLYFNVIILMLLLVMKSVKTHITDGSFNIVESGQSIVGRVGTERPARSSIQCSSMCLLDDPCHGYQYEGKRTGLGKCILIRNGCENVQSNSSAVTYKKVSSQQPDVSWNPPSNWTGPSAVLYQSFDSSDEFVLMEGNKETSVPVSVVCGKVNNAWTVDRTKRQWVDLGIDTEACMTLPETCGAAGGAISLWMNVIDCQWFGGTVSSLKSGTTGSMIYCRSSYIWFAVNLPDGYFRTSHPKATGWTHVVLNYIGPNNGEGIRMYMDGAQVVNDTTKKSASRSAGDGRVAVGRFYTYGDSNYASVQVDELTYFNASLTSDDVQLIYNAV